MTVTSASSSGNDSNRKPNVNKKPKQLVTKSPLPVPDEVAETCLAFVRRCHYPKLSLVSTIFRSLIASPELYHTRSRLNVTEPVLYVSVVSSYESPSWYVLHRKPYRNTVLLRLGKIVSLPPMPRGSAVVTIGSEIYVIGGCVGCERTFDVSIINCITNTQRSLPRMKVARSRAAAGVVDGKIYVIGGCEMHRSDWVEVFDPTEEIWIPQPEEQSWDVDLPNARGEFASYFVTKEKIHMSGGYNHYVFEPKECDASWKRRLDRPWEESSCVIDDLLFSVGPDQRSIIYKFDPKAEDRRHVLGLEGFPANIRLNESKMANFGGKLVILGPDASRVGTRYDGKTEIFCVEIALERWGGEVWGKVESVEVVLTVPNSPSLELCRTVMV